LSITNSPSGTPTSSYSGAPGQIEYTEFTLSNGLHVILHEDHKASVVCLNIAYHVGSKNENESRKGFAHLFEHLLFDGSKNVPRGDFDKFITEAGGQDNAYTTEDKTNYYEVLPSHQLELGLWLESDRMMEFGISEISLVTQKNVVKEEKRERYDNAPYGSLSERMSAMAYKRFPYSWTVIGDMETIDAATLTDVEDFFNTFYVPNNAVLVLTGNFESEEATALIKRYFEEIPRGAEIKRPIFNEDELQEERREEVTDEEVPMPAVFYGYRIPPDGTRDFMSLDLLTDVLSSGQSSRLYRKLVYEMQIGSEVSAFVDGREMPGLLYLYAFASEAEITPERLEAALQEVIDDVVQNGITQEELEKALNKTEARLIASRVTVQGKADQLAHSYLFFGDTSRANSMLTEYRSITREDVRKAAEIYLQPSKRSTVVYRMQHEGQMIDAALLSPDPYHRD
jgi:predicted Zn-dependent peptidase